MKIIETEILIVGSGPGGATVARDLTRAGRAVVLLEKGKRHPITTSRINSFRMYDKYAVFSKSKEGVIVDRAITVGGCSVVFSGTSFDPPEWLQEEIGMDLRPAASRIKKEIGINRFSEKFTKPWIGVQRLREAASDLGLDLAPQEKFIREDLCRNVCDGCMTGCRNGAKWTAREWGRMIGLFTKVADSAEGRVEADGTMRKPFNREDLRRANEATLLARDIMVGAGVNPDTIQVVENIGGHPGGTAAIGKVVDRDLAVKGVEGLYVCDASVFPRSPGRPPTLMILALAAEFSRKMIAA